MLSAGNKLLAASRWLLVVLAVTAAQSAGAELLGETIKPFAALTEIYDSNIFRVQDQAQLQALNGGSKLADFITVVSVGTALHLAPGRHLVDLLLKEELLRYVDYDDQDAERSEARGKVSLTLLDELKIKADGAYSRAPQSRSDFRSSGVNRQTSLGGGAGLEYASAVGVGLAVDYHRQTITYSLPQYAANEYADDRYAATLFYRLSPTTRLQTRYQREERRYLQPAAITLNANSVADTVQVGVEKTFSPRTTVSGTIGYLDRRHQATAVRNFSGITGTAAMAYGVSGKVGLKLNWTRQLAEETYANRIYSINDTVGGGLSYELTSKLLLSLTDQFSWKAFQDLPGSTAPDRRDQQHELAAGLEWQPLDKLAVTANYQYARRQSTEASFGFDDHTAALGVAYRF